MLCRELVVPTPLDALNLPDEAQSGPSGSDSEDGLEPLDPGSQEELQLVRSTQLGWYGAPTSLARMHETRLDVAPPTQPLLPSSTDHPTQNSSECGE